MKIETLRQAGVSAVSAETADIQAIAAAGFMRLRHCTYYLLQVVRPVEACSWLADRIGTGGVMSVRELRGAPEGAADRARERRAEASMVAFTHAGLVALGIEAHPDYPFPTAFAEGMTSDVRAKLLDDEPGAWQWRDTATVREAREVHILYARYSEGAQRSPERLIDTERDGVAIARLVETCPQYAVLDPVTGTWEGFEPFGFRDGIANPLVEGLMESGRYAARIRGSDALADDANVAAGEFILGHQNEYRERSYCPDVVGWPRRALADGVMQNFAFNGTYLAVRQIEQDVEAFRRFEASARDAGQPRLTALMVGREKDGTPLVQCPVAPTSLDAFRYRTADLEGFQCPRGSHVRRANPRDTLGHKSSAGVLASKLHRLLRRGRVFATSGDHCAQQPQEPRPHRERCGAGIFFIALNADIERQFELVHGRWINGASFGDLNAQVDPLLGPSGGAFSVPALPFGQRHPGLAAFTRVQGGGYFFAPGLRALRFIADPVRAGRALQSTGERTDG